MGFAKKGARSIARSRVQVPWPGSGRLLRTFFFGSAAIFGAAWALVRHFTHELPPLRVPVAPRNAATAEERPGELPAPDFEELDGG